jgi:hypothetical protein
MPVLTRAWNWCHKCRQPVDCADVHDGSEVRCWGCERWFTVIEYEGDRWGLTPHKPSRPTKAAPRG